MLESSALVENTQKETSSRLADFQKDRIQELLLPHSQQEKLTTRVNVIRPNSAINKGIELATELYEKNGQPWREDDSNFWQLAATDTYAKIVDNIVNRSQDPLSVKPNDHLLPNQDEEQHKVSWELLEKLASDKKEQFGYMLEGQLIREWQNGKLRLGIALGIKQKSEEEALLQGTPVTLERSEEFFDEQKWADAELTQQIIKRHPTIWKILVHEAVRNRVFDRAISITKFAEEESRKWRESQSKVVDSAEDSIRERVIDLIQAECKEKNGLAILYVPTLGENQKEMVTINTVDKQIKGLDPNKKWLEVSFGKNKKVLLCVSPAPKKLSDIEFRNRIAPERDPKTTYVSEVYEELTHQVQRFYWRVISCSFAKSLHTDCYQSENPKVFLDNLTDTIQNAPNLAVAFNKLYGDDTNMPKILTI